MARPQRLQRVVVAAVLKVLSTVVSAAAAGPPAEVKVFGMQLDTWAPPLPDVVVTYNLSLNIPQVRAFLPFFYARSLRFRKTLVVRWWTINYVIMLLSAFPPVHSRKTILPALWKVNLLLFLHITIMFLSNYITLTIRVIRDKGRQTLNNHGMISDIGLCHSACTNYLLILTVLLWNAT